MKTHLTTTDIAKHCGVSAKTVISWIDTGKLAGFFAAPSFRHRRVTTEAYHAFAIYYNLPIFAIADNP
jgi:transposase